MEGTISPYESLVNAIILQAVDDYRGALRKWKRYPQNDDCWRDKEPLERFFRSGWFGVLTSIDPEMLIRRLHEEVA